MFLKLINMNDGNDWQGLPLLLAVTVVWRRSAALRPPAERDQIRFFLERRGSENDLVAAKHLVLWWYKRWESIQHDHKPAASFLEMFVGACTRGKALMERLMDRNVYKSFEGEERAVSIWNHAGFLKILLGPTLVNVAAKFEMFVTFGRMPDCHFPKKFPSATLRYAIPFETTDSPLLQNYKSICYWCNFWLYDWVPLSLILASSTSLQCTAIWSQSIHSIRLCKLKSALTLWVIHKCYSATGMFWPLGLYLAEEVEVKNHCSW